MRLASRIAWRSLVSRPGRTVTSALGIAVGVAAVLSVLIVDHNTILTEVLRRPSYSGHPDVEIRPLETAAPGKDIPEALRRDGDLRQLMPIFTSRIRLHPASPAAALDVELIALDPAAGDRFGAWQIVDGDGFQSMSAHDVLLPRSLAQELHLAPGDTLGLQRALPPRRECADGKVVQVQEEQLLSAVQPFTVAGLIEDDHLGRRRAALVPFSAGLELFAGAYVQVQYWARLAPEAIYQDVRERLKAGFVVDKPKSALVGERVDQRAFRKSIRIAAMLSLLLGLFVIYNAFSLALVERVREIGLLRAIGLTQTEIAFAVVLEGAILAVLGALAGLALSLLVVFGMVEAGITTLGFNKPLSIHEIPWSTVMVVLAAGAGAALLGVIAPLFRVRRMAVIEAVRAGQIAYQPDPGRFVRALLLALLPGLLIVVYVAATPPLGERQDDVFRIVAKISLWLSATFGLVLLLPKLLQGAVVGVLRLLLLFRPVERPIAVATTRGSHHRVFGSTIGIALVLAAVMAIHGITASLMDESARFADRTMAGRIFLQTNPMLKADVAKAAQLDGVSAFYSLSAEVAAPFWVRGVDAEAAIAFVPQLQASQHLADEFRAGRSIVLSEFLAQNYDYRVGDEVKLSSSKGPVAVRVAAIGDEFGYFPDDRSFAVMADHEFARVFCMDDTRGSQYVFHVDDERRAGGIRDAILGRLPQGDVLRLRTAAEIKHFYLADMARDFWIFQVILGLTALLAFVGLWNSLTVAMLERRREIGLLRTLGFTPAQLGGMLAAESVALGLVGGGLALLAGGPVSHYLVEAIRVISRYDVRYVLGTSGMLWVPVLAAGLALLATVPPAMRVRSLVVASATRME